MKYSNTYTWFGFVVACMLMFVGFAWANEKQVGNSARAEVKTAMFAGGCFWCMEPPFDKLKGVLSTVSGYTGGLTKNPTYEDVSYKDTGHFEAVEVSYDPLQINYETLLTVFWHNVDPLNAKGQFCDNGESYRTAIFYLDEAQKIQAEMSITELGKSNFFNKPIVTQLFPAKTFYPAEDYHQDYYKKNPVRYKYYRYACGRDKRLNELWNDLAGKPGALLPRAK